MTRLRWALRAVAIVVILGGAIGLWRIAQPRPDPETCAHVLEMSLIDSETVAFADADVAFSSVESAVSGRLDAALSAGQAYDCAQITAPEEAPFARVFELSKIAEDKGLRVRYAASE